METRSNGSRIIYALLGAALGICLTIIGNMVEIFLNGILFGRLITGLGLALTITGLASAFREIFLLRSELHLQAQVIAERMLAQFELPEGKRFVSAIAGYLTTQLPESQCGFRLLAFQRARSSHYVNWACTSQPESLFFAGRSVMHRMHQYLQDSGLGSVVEVLGRKVTSGSDVTILLLDPRSDVVKRMAEEEMRDEKIMLRDIAESLGLVKRLFDDLDSKKLPANAQIAVSLYALTPYFAYHKAGSEVTVGFYFLGAMGWESPAYQVMEETTRDWFQRHFQSLMDRPSTKKLLHRSPLTFRLEFDQKLYDDLHAFLEEKLGADVASSLL